MIMVTARPMAVKSRTRWAESLALALAGACLLASLLFPIWRITLEAPQYPEGMGMQIWARTIVGENPHDLDIINELNHYIGMKKIVPEAIPELRMIMPLVCLFGVLCLLAAIRPRIWSTALVLAGLTGAGVAGMIDFWKWEYDYGHDLNPMAAIKVPGMTYQPPLIGEAKLLNFLSTSWPAMGGLLMFIGGGLIALSLALSLAARFGFFRRAAAPSLPKAGAGFALMCLLFNACSQEPAPFAWGEDTCHFCKMVLMQKGFAAQRINAKGKVYKFDAVECLLGDLQARPFQEGEAVLVSDRSLPEASLFNAHGAFYLKSPAVASPMGAGLAAFASRDSVLAFQTRIGGTLLEWDGLQRL
jgi:copper chaperone NosL